MANPSSSLEKLFSPNQIAVIGASRNAKAIGGKIVHALLQSHYQGTLYPINPKAELIQGVRAYPSVLDLPGPVDMAVIAVPAEHVLKVVDQCYEKGIRFLVTITANFAEVGQEGKNLQQELLAKLRRYGMRMVGPNCFGIINTMASVSMNASFSPVFPFPGKIAMASQSGAMGLTVLGLSHQYQVGLSTFVSMGNKADISSNDLIEYWDNDPHTDVILLYLESFGNPQRFAKIARRVGRKKPIVAVKSGRTTAGSRAAGSHTAALANNDSAVEALFHQTGVLRAETVEEMFELGTALSYQPLPEGRRAAVITNAGGPAILCTDACEAGGIDVPEFSPELQAKVRGHLSQSASVRNPVDMVASANPTNYKETIATVLSSKEVDSLVILYAVLEEALPLDLIEAVQDGIAEGRKNGATHIPVFFCLMTAAAPHAPLQVGTEQVPIYDFPEKPAAVLSKLCRYAEWRALPAASEIWDPGSDFSPSQAVCRKALAERGPGWLLPDEIQTIFQNTGMPVPTSGVAKTIDEAVSLAEKIGFPVALKLASRTLVHKTELGGVQLGLKGASDVRAAFENIAGALSTLGKLNEMDGVLIQPMLAGGTEIFVGMTRDPLFGPLIAFGLGGIYVEVLSDIVFRVAPLSEHDAKEMLRSIRGSKLLEGYRGHPPADEKALCDLLLRTSRLSQQIPEISTLDLNPVFAFPPGKGCLIADARIAVQKA